MRMLRRMETVPESGSRRPERILSSVDFPEPLGPMSPRRSPSEIPSEMFSKSIREPKLLEREEKMSRMNIEELALRTEGEFPHDSSMACSHKMPTPAVPRPEPLPFDRKAAMAVVQRWLDFGMKGYWW